MPPGLRMETTIKDSLGNIVSEMVSEQVERNSG